MKRIDMNRKKKTTEKARNIGGIKGEERGEERQSKHHKKPKQKGKKEKQGHAIYMHLNEPQSYL